MPLTISNFKEHTVTIDYIDEAYARCGIDGRTGYHLKTAIRSINFLFSDWANRGINRWLIQQEQTDLIKDTSLYELTDINNVDILSMVIRTDAADVNKQADTTMTRVSRSEFLNIPNKLSTGKPNLFYLDRQDGSNNMVLKIWPTPDKTSTYSLVYDMLHSQDSSDASQTEGVNKIPFRFMQCLASGLAYQLAIKFAPDRVGMLKQEYEEDFRRAAEEDRDRSSLKLVPNGAYTRV